MRCLYMACHKHEKEKMHAETCKYCRPDLDNIARIRAKKEERLIDDREAVVRMARHAFVRGLEKLGRNPRLHHLRIQQTK